MGRGFSLRGSPATVMNIIVAPEVSPLEAFVRGLFGICSYKALLHPRPLATSKVERIWGSSWTLTSQPGGFLRSFSLVIFLRVVGVYTPTHYWDIGLNKILIDQSKNFILNN